MIRSLQSRVPEKFSGLFAPSLNLKKLMTSKQNELSGGVLIESLVVTHYSTFLMMNLYKQCGRNIDKITEIRTLIEQIMKEKTFFILPEHKSKISSFVDALGKELNVTPEPYVYIAIYDAYLDVQIYRHFYPALGEYSFASHYIIDLEMMEQMKNYSILSREIIKANPFIEDKSRKI